MFTTVEGPGYATKFSEWRCSKQLMLLLVRWRLEAGASHGSHFVQLYKSTSCFKPSNCNNSRRVQLYKSSWHPEHPRVRVASTLGHQFCSISVLQCQKCCFSKCLRSLGFCFCSLCFFRCSFSFCHDGLCFSNCMSCSH